MGTSQQAKDAYAKYKKFKKAKSYYDAVKKLIDEDTRSEGIFKLGLKGLTQLGEKVVGKGLTKHPYFTFHKVHLEVLASVLTASDTHNNAMRALEQAIQAADSAAALSSQVKLLTDRKQSLKLAYVISIAPTQQFLRDASRDRGQADQDIAGSGQTVESIAARSEIVLDDWRAEVCLLFSDSVDLLAMVDIEYRAASAAYARFVEKTKKLQQSNKSIDRIAGLAAEKKRQEEWAMRELDRAFNRSNNTPAPEAVIDPSRYAQRQRDGVEAVVDVLGKVCDVAMSSDPRYPNKIAVSMGSL